MNHSRHWIIYKFIISYQSFMAVKLFTLQLDFDNSFIKLPSFQCLRKDKYDDDCLQPLSFIDKAHQCILFSFSLYEYRMVLYFHLLFWKVIRVNDLNYHPLHCEIVLNNILGIRAMYVVGKDSHLTCIL